MIYDINKDIAIITEGLKKVCYIYNLWYLQTVGGLKRATQT